MKCLTDINIEEYIDGALTNVESAIVRDHLIVCQSCNTRYESFYAMEKVLREPLFIEPPSIIERNVLKELF
ncbi:MAG: hypothetical protein GY751_00975, partial [Bacteroidetes bacterium]|nr:hypothetical protein [Bacteroidota bacterium]